MSESFAAIFIVIVFSIFIYQISNETKKKNIKPESDEERERRMQEVFRQDKIKEKERYLSGNYLVYNNDKIVISETGMEVFFMKNGKIIDSKSTLKLKDVRQNFNNDFIFEVDNNRNHKYSYMQYLIGSENFYLESMIFERFVLIGKTHSIIFNINSAYYFCPLQYIINGMNRSIFFTIHKREDIRYLNLDELTISTRKRANSFFYINNQPVDFGKLY